MERRSSRRRYGATSGLRRLVHSNEVGGVRVGLEWHLLTPELLQDIGESNRLNALGAVAESQSRRGLVDAARSWIDRDVSPEDRAVLHRRVDEGLLTVIQLNRSRALSNQDR